MSKTSIDRLKRLLETEKSLLLSGNLAGVADLTEEKEALTTSLENGGPSDLLPLAAQLQENGRLMAAAKTGVAQVLETLRQQRAARASLSTYDRHGTATHIGAVREGTSRRF